MAEAIRFKVTHNFHEIGKLSEKYPAESLRARRAKVLEAILLLERNIKRSTPEGAGPIHLRDTIHEQMFQWGKKVIGQVGTPAYYAKPLEYGQRPHFPPVKRIQFWVEGKFHLSGKEARNMAWAVARKIEDVGAEGKHMFQYATEDSMVRIFKILEQIPADIIRRVQHGLG